MGTKEQARLEKDLASWLERAVGLGASKVLVLRLKPSGAVAGAPLREIVAETLVDAQRKYAPEKGRAEAGLVAQKVYRIARDAKQSAQYALAWARRGQEDGDEQVVEQEPFLVDYGVFDEDGDEVEAPGGSVRTREDALQLLADALKDERRHSRKLYRITGAVLEKSWGVQGGAIAALQARSDMLEAKSMDVLKTSLEQQEQRHRFEMEKLQKTAANNRTETMLKQGGEILKVLAPSVKPQIEAFFKKPGANGTAAAGGEAAGGQEAQPMPELPRWAVDVIGEVNGLFQKQQAQIDQRKEEGQALGTRVEALAGKVEQVLSAVEALRGAAHPDGQLGRLEALLGEMKAADEARAARLEAVVQRVEEVEARLIPREADEEEEGAEEVEPVARKTPPRTRQRN